MIPSHLEDDEQIRNLALYTRTRANGPCDAWVLARVRDGRRALRLRVPDLFLLDVVLIEDGISVLSATTF